MFLNIPNFKNLKNIDQQSIKNNNLKISMVLIGCGDIGSINADAINSSIHSNLIGVYDINESLSDNLSTKYKCKKFNTFEEILNDNEVNTVILALPHNLHYIYAKKILNCNKNIIIEKPLGRNFFEANKIKDLYDKSSSKLSVLFPLRYRASCHKAKEFINLGYLGEINSISININIYRNTQYWTGGFSGRSKNNWRTQKELSGGGIIIMNVIHYIDLMFWIMGSRNIDLIKSNYTEGPYKGIENNLSASFIFNKNIIGAIKANSISSGEHSETVIFYGSNGTLEVGSFLKIELNKSVGNYKKGKYFFKSFDIIHERALYFNKYSIDLLNNNQTDIDIETAIKVQESIEKLYNNEFN